MASSLIDMFPKSKLPPSLHPTTFRFHFFDPPSTSDVITNSSKSKKKKKKNKLVVQKVNADDTTGIDPDENCSVTNAVGGEVAPETQSAVDGIYESRISSSVTCSDQHLNSAAEADDGGVLPAKKKNTKKKKGAKTKGAHDDDEDIDAIVKALDAAASAEEEEKRKNDSSNSGGINKQVPSTQCTPMMGRTGVPKKKKESDEKASIPFSFKSHKDPELSQEQIRLLRRRAVTGPPRSQSTATTQVPSAAATAFSFGFM